MENERQFLNFPFSTFHFPFFHRLSFWLTRLSGNRGSRGGIEIFRARSARNVNKISYEKFV